MCPCVVDRVGAVDAGCICVCVLVSSVRARGVSFHGFSARCRVCRVHRPKVVPALAVIDLTMTGGRLYLRTLPVVHWW